MCTIPTSRGGVPAFPLGEIARTASHMHYMSLQVHRGLEHRELRGGEISEGDLS